MNYINFDINTSLEELKDVFKDGNYDERDIVTMYFGDYFGAQLDLCVSDNLEATSAIYLLVFDKEWETLTTEDDYYTDFEFDQEKLQNDDFEGLMKDAKGKMEKAFMKLIVRYFNKLYL